MKKVFVIILFVLTANISSAETNYLLDFVESNPNLFVHEIDTEDYKVAESTKDIIILSLYNREIDQEISLLCDIDNNKFALTFVAFEPNSFDSIAPGAVFYHGRDLKDESGNIVSPDCLTTKSCDETLLRKFVLEYLNFALRPNRSESHKELLATLDAYKLSINYETLDVSTYTRDKCKDSCAKEIDVFVEDDEVRAGRVSTRLIVETMEKK